MNILNFQEVVSQGFWAFSSAVGMMIVLLSFFLYLYYRKRLIAVVGDAKDEAGIAASVEQLRKDEESLRNWIAHQKDELQRYAAERNEQELLRSELQRTEQDCAKNEEINRTLREEVGNLEHRQYTLSQASQLLEKSTADLEEGITSLRNRKLELDQKYQNFNAEVTEREKDCNQLVVQQELKNAQLQEIEKKCRETKNDVESLEFKHHSLTKAVESLKIKEQEVDLLNKKILEAAHELKDTKNEVAIQQRFEDDAARKVKTYYEEISEFKSLKVSNQNKIDETENIIDRLKIEFKNVNQQVGDVRTNLTTKQKELAEVNGKLVTQQQEEKKTALKVHEQLEEIEKLITRRTELNALIETLKTLAKKYDIKIGGKGTDGSDKYLDLWQPVTFPQLAPSNEAPSEKDLLEQTANYIKGQQLYFPERVLYAFHTALKVNEISPLVVLAGISGTGKSELPRRYAEGMGMHNVILAVQPRWDSPQDLFGFYNYLEERYKATELARAMVQFEQYNRDSWPMPEGWNFDRSDRILLVLLDEMNLARVEYYFSEFLSRLEIRRGINLNSFEERAKAELALEMGSLTEGEKPIRIFPGQNVLFTGTMNEDETTQALSDKVLDRSCVLRFGRPKEIMMRADEPVLEATSTGLTYKQWDGFKTNSLSAENRARVTAWINTLNDAMEQLNRPFGHRVAQAIQSYVSNYPDWAPGRIELAMADQIEQRIMPKLRGIEVGDATEPLEKIHEIIRDCDDDLLEHAFRQGCETQQQVFIWRGLDRTEGLSH